MRLRYHRITKDVLVNNVSLNALIDTGNQVTFMYENASLRQIPIGNFPTDLPNHSCGEFD